MVNHILTDIFAHAKMGAAGGLRGKISLATFNKAHHKKQIQAEKNKTTKFFLLCFSF